MFDSRHIYRRTVMPEYESPLGAARFRVTLQVYLLRLSAKASKMHTRLLRSMSRQRHFSSVQSRRGFRRLLRRNERGEYSTCKMMIESFGI